MNELREEMAMCAHMRVQNKKVLLDGTESGRISDSWVCGDCGTLFTPEAANREQKAEIERLKSQWAATDHTLKHDCSRALVALSGAGICTPAETYGVNTSWAISDLCRAVVKQSEELASLRASVGEKWISYRESKPVYGETVEVLFSGPEIALCRLEQEELAEDDMREPEDILWDENGDQERSVMGIFWRKFVAPTLPGEEK